MTTAVILSLATSVIILLVLLLLLYTYFWQLKTGAETVASFPVARRKMLEIVQADFNRRTDARPYTVIDMGSGGGQLCSKIARNLPQAKVIGVELSPLPWLRSVVTQAVLGPRNLRFVRGDFWGFDVSAVDAVVVFLRPIFKERLGQKLHRELKPGTLIVSNEVQLGDGWEPLEDQIIKLYGVVPVKIHVYRQV